MATNKLLDLAGLKEFKTKQDTYNADLYVADVVQDDSNTVRVLTSTAPRTVAIGVKDGGITSTQLADGAVTLETLASDVTDTFLTEIPIASATTIGGIKVGDNLTITKDGVLSAGTDYELPVATTTVLGGVKASAVVTVSSAGVMGIGAGQITSAMLQDGGIATADIANGAVTLAKIATDAVATTAEIDALFA